MSERTIFGFWIYLMTDCILFGVLFASYAVLSPATAGGPSSKELFDLPRVFLESILFLTSSFTFLVAMLPPIFADGKKRTSLLLLTFALGALFLAMQIEEMVLLVEQGALGSVSAFLSAYWTLLGTHALHLFFALFFLAFFLLELARRRERERIFMRLTCLRLFWLFLGLIWVLMFTFVSLSGAY